MKIYLILSILVALYTIFAGASSERYMDDTPMGDSDCVSGLSVFSFKNIIFFPSIIIVLAWMGIVKIVDAVRY